MMRPMKIMFRPRNAACLLAIATAALVTPAIASASTVWVSSGAVKAPFNSCTNPGYNHIQQALEVNAAGTAVHVCSGTYKEQLVIGGTASLVAASGATLELPATVKEASTACKFAHPGQVEQALIEICTKSSGEAVKISGLKIDGVFPSESCAPETYDVTAGGGAKLQMTNDQVIGPVIPEALIGCQSGVGIQVGRKAAGQAASATLTDDQISEYGKNGVTVDGPGSLATIKGGTVTNQPSPYTANNGIQISRGAKGSINGTEISGNECNAAVCGPDGLKNEQAAGVLLYEAGSGTAVTKAKITKNDIGIYHSSEVETTSPQATLNSDELLENRYIGILLDQGYASMNKDTITGPGDVGIELIQYAGQAFGVKGKGNEDTVSGMSSYAVFGNSDLNAGDQFGSFTIAKSAISGNPSGADLEESVSTNNPTKLRIITNSSDS
jgi:hypothetical protein